MDGMEMRTLSETSRIVEKVADFAGNIILQLMQKQNYVEQQGIKALLNHVKKGKETLTTIVSAERAEEFKAYVKAERIPFVEIEHVDSQTKERCMIFIYRDNDRNAMQRALKQFEMNLDKECHEVDLDSFIQMCDKKPYGMVGSMSRAEVYAFREAAKNYNMYFSVVQDRKQGEGSTERYAIICSDKEKLQDAVSEVAYNLSGTRGREYSASLNNYFQLEQSFEEKMKPEPGKVKYIVNAKNPSNFITVDEQGITTHSVGRRPERGTDGVVRDVIYDAKHITYPGFNKKLLKQLALELKNPIILSEEAFPLVQGFSKTKEAILSQDFVEQFKPFVEMYKKRNPDFGKIPIRRELYVREDLIGLSGLPAIAVKAITLMELPDVYVDGSDVAYPKELDSQMDLILEEFVFQDMSPEEKVKLKQEYMGKEENRAIDYMLQIEQNEREMVKVPNIPFPDVLSETQKEALERKKDKDVKEQTMNKDVAKVLREREVSRRMEQDMDR